MELLWNFCRKPKELSSKGCLKFVRGEAEKCSAVWCSLFLLSNFSFDHIYCTSVKKHHMCNSHLGTWGSEEMENFETLLVFFHDFAKKCQWFFIVTMQCVLLWFSYWSSALWSSLFWLYNFPITCIVPGLFCCTCVIAFWETHYHGVTMYS